MAALTGDAVCRLRLTQKLFFAAALCAANLGNLTAISLAENPLPTKEAIAKASNDRAARIRTIDLRWKALTDFSAGRVRELAGKGDPFGNGKGPENPRQRAALFEWEGRFVVAGDKMRSESNCPLWHFEAGEFTQRKSTSVWNGTYGENIRGPFEGLLFPMSGLRFPAEQKQSLLASNIGLWGISWHIQAANSPSYFARMLREEAQVSSEKKDGIDYVVVSKTIRNNFGRQRGYRLSLSPATEFILHEWEKTVDGAVVDRVSIQFVQDPHPIWIPKSWKHNEFDVTGQLLKSEIATVTSCTVNEPIPEETFRLTFPAWTLITDTRRAEHREVVVLPNGSERVLTREELSRIKTKEDLMKLMKVESL